jgi:hypothetical protein
MTAPRCYRCGNRRTDREVETVARAIGAFLTTDQVAQIEAGLNHGEKADHLCPACLTFEMAEVV